MTATPHHPAFCYGTAPPVGHDGDPSHDFDPPCYHSPFYGFGTACYRKVCGFGTACVRTSWPEALSFPFFSLFGLINDPRVPLVMHRNGLAPAPRIKKLFSWSEPPSCQFLLCFILLLPPLCRFLPPSLPVLFPPSLSLSLSVCSCLHPLLLLAASPTTRGSKGRYTPNGGTIEDEEGGYRGYGIYMLVDTRAYESEQS